MFQFAYPLISEDFSLLSVDVLMTMFFFLSVLLSFSASAATPAAVSTTPLLQACLPPHDAYAFCNMSLSISERVDDLLGRLTVAEQVGMTFMSASMAYGNSTLGNASIAGGLPSTAVERLGLPQFNWMGQGNIYRGASNGCNLGCCSCYDGHNMSNCCVDRSSAGSGATQFPQGTGVAAMFNKDLAFRMGVATSDESLALNNHLGPGKHVEYRTGASSVINIVRDVRWGRTPETYGECPQLTAEVAIALNKGLMGFASRDAPAPQYEYGLGGRGDPRWKTIPVMRHMTAYAGPDNGRFTFDARVSEDDLHLTYLEPWRRLVAAKAIGGVMSAISALNGIPSAADGAILNDVLRGEWDYDSFVTSDCDTISAIATDFHYTATVEEAAAVAIKAGGDLNCGPEYVNLLNATQKDKLVGPDVLSTAVRRLLTARFRVGALDPPGHDPYAGIPITAVDSPAHRALARAAARESVVLLLNQPADGGKAGGGTVPALPLQFESSSSSSSSRSSPSPNPSPSPRPAGGAIRTLAVIGPSADDPAVQAHTYHGTPSRWVTVLDAIKEEETAIRRARRAAGEASSFRVVYARGCDRHDQSTAGFAEAIQAAKQADAVVFVGGLQASDEEEDTDRPNLKLPGPQLALLQAIHGNVSDATAVVTVIISGGPIAEPWLMDSKPQDGTEQRHPQEQQQHPQPTGAAPRRAPRHAVLWSSYFGQDGGGIVDALLGRGGAPSGRLPWTVPRDVSQLGAITDYDMTSGPGRTYRYLNYSTAPPLFPFAFGLSYGPFPSWTSQLEIKPAAAGIDDVVTVTAEFAFNSGGIGSSRRVPGQVVVALFVEDAGAACRNDGDTGLNAAAWSHHPSPPCALGPVPPALPRRALVNFTKLQGQSGKALSPTFTFRARELPFAVERRPLPGALKFWVGDAMNAVATGTLQITG